MAPSVGHLLLKGLDGNTSCLRFYSPTITGAAIQQQISSILRLPVDSLLILSGTRLIFPDTTLSADTHGFFPSCSLSVPLPGGKGGFGSLLRGAGTKAGQKKTSNFDACRDMSGRRLRHVNAEKKLKEWKAQAKERELEKVANEFLKKQAKQKEKSSESSQAMEKFEKEIFKTKEEIESAVAVGLAEAKKLGKRKVVEDESLPPSSSKYARIWFDDVGTDEDDASDEDDESGEDDASDVDNDRQVSRGSDEELEDGPNHDKVLVCSGAEEGSRMKSENLLQLPKSEAESESASEIGKSESESASELGKSEEVTEGAKAEAAIENRKLEEDAERAEAESASEIEKSGGGVLCARVESTSEIRKSGEGSECVTAEGDVEGAVIGMELSESLDFDKFLHPSDMEVLGLERLKQELQKRGLKCGGSLAERAGRLFLLKTCSLENLDKKHFAKEKKP